MGFSKVIGFTIRIFLASSGPSDDVSPPRLLPFQSRQRGTHSVSASSGEAMLCGLGTKLKLSGNEVYYTACSLLVIFQSSSSKLQWQAWWHNVVRGTLRHVPKERGTVADGTLQAGVDVTRCKARCPPKALRGGISKSILQRPCQFLTINAHEMAPRTKRWLQERRRDTPT